MRQSIGHTNEDKRMRWSLYGLWPPFMCSAPLPKGHGRCQSIILKSENHFCSQTDSNPLSMNATQTSR